MCFPIGHLVFASQCNFSERKFTANTITLLVAHCRIEENTIANYFAQTCQHSNVRKCA
uniref:Uncharacterized protein n=1 Tax=Anguilla anguilla TaxID=7936 RepID=A0A0E9SBA1_ANGAN